MAAAMASSSVRRVFTTPLATMASQTHTGVVVSSGKMNKTIKVRIPRQQWNRKIQKYFASSVSHLVHDPNNSCLEGDVVQIRSGWRTAKRVRHVVTAIVAPMGPPVSQRPPVPTEEERLTAVEKWRAEKDVRQASRGRKEAIGRIRFRKREEKLAREVERHEARRAGKAPVHWTEGEREMKAAIKQLTKQRDAESVERLNRAVEEIKEIYRSTRGKEQHLMWKQPWMRAILGDEAFHAKIIGMMRDGKWAEEEIVAENIATADYLKANQVATQIMMKAAEYRRRKVAQMWNAVAEATKGHASLKAIHDAAQERLPKLSPPEDAMLADEQLVVDWAAASQILPFVGGDTTSQQAITTLAKALVETTAIRNSQRAEAEAPSDAQISTLRSALSDMTEKSTAIQTLMKTSDGGSESLLRLARALYDGEVRRAQSRIERFERTKALLEQYPAITESFAMLGMALHGLGWTRKQAGRLLNEYARVSPVEEHQNRVDAPGAVDGAAAERAENSATSASSEHHQAGQSSLSLEGEKVTSAQTAAAVAEEIVGAQRAEAERLETGDKELQPSVEVPKGEQPRGPVNERALHNVRQAEKFVAKAIDNEAEAEELAKQKDNEAGGQEGEEKKTEEQGGGLFGWFKKP